MDAFEKRFRKVTGSSPKQFCNIIRVQEVIKNISEAEEVLSLALESGFYDQAHFIKEFKSFTGLTPLEYLGDLSNQ